MLSFTSKSRERNPINKNFKIRIMNLIKILLLSFFVVGSVTTVTANYDYEKIDTIISDTLTSFAGTIATEYGLPLEGVFVYEDAGPITATDSVGQYLFRVPSCNYAGVEPESDLLPTVGINSIDLVLIMRHILGIQELDSPYKIIAADVSNDGRVTVSDVLLIRKMILGLIPEFPNGPTWKFVDKSWQFPDTLRPWPIVDKIWRIDLSTPKFDADFIGMKMGDVDESFDGTGMKKNTDAEVRSARAVQVESISSVDGGVLLVFDRPVELFEGVLQASSPLKVTDAMHVQLSPNTVKVAYLGDGTRELFIPGIEAKTALQLGKDSKVVVEDGGTIEYRSVEYTLPTSMIKLYPNPTDGFITVEGADIEATYLILSPEGKMVKNGRVNRSTTIDLSDLPNGIYIYQDSNNSNIRVVKI